jgi:mRNA interferase MazF
MTNYQAGDLVLIAFPYTGGTQSGVRPGLVLLDTGDADVVVARVTTQTHTTPHDVVLSGWQQAGLLGPSVVRLHKLATLEKRLVSRFLGHLEAGDRQRVAAVLNQTFGSW